MKMRERERGYCVVLMIQSCEEDEERKRRNENCLKLETYFLFVCLDRYFGYVRASEKENHDPNEINNGKKQ